MLKYGSSFTSLNQVLFYNATLETLDSIVKGSDADYMIGCYKFKNSNLASITLTQDPNKSLREQCAKRCIDSSNQVRNRQLP